MTSIGRQVLNKWVLLAVAMAAVLAAVLAMQPVAAQDEHHRVCRERRRTRWPRSRPQTLRARRLSPGRHGQRTLDHPEGDGDLAATDIVDNASFAIDEDGMLTFNSPPDFENPATTNATANTYKVVVLAC